MPLSKRTAAAARLSAKSNTKDFSRKKIKLGKKAQAQNATNTSFKSKQIYIPIQGRQQIPDIEKTGLTLPELLTRATHYNLNTRLAAFNAITKSLNDEHTSAFQQAHAQRSTIISTALHALQDENPQVRAAALKTLVQVLHHTTSIAPFAPLLSSQILATLSHIRVEVRLHAAKTLSALLCVPHISPIHIFPTSGPNPLDALLDLLSAVNKSHTRSIVLEAIASVCEDASPDQNIPLPTTSKKSHFFYHRTPTSQTQSEPLVPIPQLLATLSEERAASLLVQIIYIITECLPISEINKDVPKMHMLTMAVKALRYVTCPHSISSKSKKPLQRTIDTWAKERNRQSCSLDEHVIHMSFAEAALTDARFEIVERYLSSVLCKPRQKSRSERQVHISKWLNLLLLRFMKDCSNPKLCERVSKVWVESWLSATKADDIAHIASSIPVFDTVLQSLVSQEDFVSNPSNLAWSLLHAVPKLVCTSLGKRDVSTDADAKVTNSNNEMYSKCENALLHNTSNIFQRLAGSPNDQLKTLADNIVNMICKVELFNRIDMYGLEQLLAILYNGRALLHDSILKIMIQTSLSKDGEMLEIGRAVVSTIESFIVQGYHTNMGERTLALVAAAQVMLKHLKGKEGLEGELLAQVERMVSILS